MWFGTLIIVSNIHINTVIQSDELFKFENMFSLNITYANWVELFTNRL